MKYREEVADGVLGSNSKLSKLKQFFVSLYPHIHLVLEALDFCKSSSFNHSCLQNISIFIPDFLLSFTLQKSPHHSLLSYLLGIHLVTLTQERMREKEGNLNMSSNSELKSLNCTSLKSLFPDYGALISLALVSAQSFAKIVRFSLETGSFFLQFLGKNQST